MWKKKKKKDGRRKSYRYQTKIELSTDDLAILKSNKVFKNDAKDLFNNKQNDDVAEKTKLNDGEKKKKVVKVDKKLIEEKLNQAKKATDSGIGVLPLIVKENTPANKVKCETAKTDNKTVTKTMPKEITSSPAINSTRNTQQPRQEKEEEPQVPKGGGCCTIS